MHASTVIKSNVGNTKEIDGGSSNYLTGSFLLVAVASLSGPGGASEVPGAAAHLLCFWAWEMGKSGPARAERAVAPMVG
jgi:hypothetical protein